MISIKYSQSFSKLVHLDTNEENEEEQKEVDSEEVDGDKENIDNLWVDYDF
jgi:hypothetical protein